MSVDLGHVVMEVWCAGGPRGSHVLAEVRLRPGDIHRVLYVRGRRGPGIAGGIKNPDPLDLDKPPADQAVTSSSEHDGPLDRLVRKTSADIARVSKVAAEQRWLLCKCGENDWPGIEQLRASAPTAWAPGDTPTRIKTTRAVTAR